MDSRWDRATFIAVDRDKDQALRHVLFAIQDIQEEKEKELETVRENERRQEIAVYPG